MKPLNVAVLTVLVIALLMLHDVDAARRRSGGRRSRGGSRGRRASRSSQSNQSKQPRRRSSVRRIRSSSTPKITKTTPIKPITFRTPVIKSQAKLFTKAAAGYLVTTYALSRAPSTMKSFHSVKDMCQFPRKER